MLQELVVKKGQRQAAFQLRLGAVCGALKACGSLEPGRGGDELFKTLVELVRNGEASGVDINSEWLNVLRMELNILCARGEGLLEKYWAAKFLGSQKLTWDKVEEFIYFKNYQVLTEWEIQLMTDYLKAVPCRILFVGSGGLPLSAMLMASRYGVAVDCLDKDAEAVRNSRDLMERLGLNDLVKIEQGDFYERRDFAGYDLVIVAALVGINEMEKRRMLAHLRANLPEEQAFLLRSADGLKGLFYQEIKSEWLSDFIDVQVFQPCGEVINSVILAKNL